MKYKVLQVFTLCTLFGVSTLYAQTEGSSKKFSMAILFGNGIYLAEPAIPASPTTADWTVSGEAPYASGISTNNSLTNMIGAEFRYFVSNGFALKLNGSGIFRNTPAADNVPGVTPATSEAVDPTSPNAGWIPNYAATVMDNSLNVNVSVGGEFHIATGTQVLPYVGVMVPFGYGRKSQYNPTTNVSMATGLAAVTDVGVRHIETIGFGGQLVFGADYNLTEGFYLGVEIKPVAYLYAYKTKCPAPGLETRSADTHTYGFFTQPVFKIGVRF